MRGLRFFIVLAAAFAVTAAFAATGAWAVTVQVSSTNLRVDALTGETNNITVTDGGTNWVVTDSTATVAVPASDQCTLVGAEARCPKADVTGILIVRAGDLNDVVRNQTALVSDMRGGNGDDDVFGGSRRDVIDPDSGADTVVAGDGNDIVHTRSVTLPDNKDITDCGNGTDRITADLNDEPTRCERLTLYGNNADNIVEGTPRADILYGLGGDDVLSGFGSGDRLFGGTGHDRLNGSTGRDALVGSSGNDVLRGGRSRDGYNAGSGNDLIGAVDRTNELIRCGRGIDKAYVNRGDRTRSCERVIFRRP